MTEQAETFQLTTSNIRAIITSMGWEDIDFDGFIDAARYLTNKDYSSGPKRSEPGRGDMVKIYVLGRADKHADSMIPSYGQISAGCGPNIGEDFAETRWPVVVKVELGVPDEELAQHLRDLADSIPRKVIDRDNYIPS